jgi:hypothetical protein
VSHDDEFDLDLQIRPPGVEGVADGLRTLGNEAGETVGPEATCPAETCGLDCQTVGCTQGCETHGCNTSETCDQVLCSDAITFGPYCEDQSDDTCHACQPGGTAECADPPDE